MTKIFDNYEYTDAIYIYNVYSPFSKINTAPTKETGVK